MKVKRIKIRCLNVKHLTCNCCKKEGEKQLNEVVFGADKEHIVAHLCNDCLNELADVMWEFLEKNGDER